MIQHVPSACNQEHHVAVNRKQFQCVPHCIWILTWQVMAFRVIYIPHHYKERLMFLYFVFAIHCSRRQLLTLNMTHSDSSCIVLHLYGVSQDHSGNVILIQELNAENHRSKRPCTSTQHSNYLAIFFFSFYVTQQDITPNPWSSGNSTYSWLKTNQQELWPFKILFKPMQQNFKSILKN